MLDVTEVEAVLSALVVVSQRSPLSFLVRCKPDEFQPILSLVAQDLGSHVARRAAVMLLGRLRFVDLTPATGPSLPSVIASALTDASPAVQDAALSFTRHIRRVRGGSLVSSLIEHARTCPNETQAWAYARLAEAQSRAAGSSGQDRRAVRAFLRTGLNSPAYRRLAFLAGIGAENDPVRVLVQGHLDAELRRLAQLPYSRHLG